MAIINKKEPILLVFGDVVLMLISLWLTLFFRYGEFPDLLVWQIHSGPFAVIFACWVLVFYVSGLYERQTSFLRSKLNTMLPQVHGINSAIAIAFFYFVPIFNITPKTNLFIFILISFCLLYIWRVFLYSKIISIKKQKAVLIGSGKEVHDVYQTVNKDSHYGLDFVDFLDIENHSLEGISSKFIFDKLKQISQQDLVVVIDLHNQNIEPLLPTLYGLLFAKVKFIDFYDVYEDVFGKIPFSLVGHSWFIENVAVSYKMYDILKRILDIIASFTLGIISLLFYPFVIIAIKLEGKGSIFITQERAGQNGKKIKIYKFRSMLRNEDGVWINESKNQITKVGAFLRKSSFDEFPQLWNVFKGDMSLIGPRPDMVGLESRLSQEIPYYGVRYLIKPGLSGWAQIKQDIIPQNIEENKDRLAYDFYYMKHRSLLLDIKISLRTIKTLLKRGGR